MGCQPYGSSMLFGPASSHVSGIYINPKKCSFILFFATFLNAYNSFFNSFEKTFLGISECSKHKTKVQLLMYTFEKVLKIQNLQKIGKKILSAMHSRIFQIFQEFSFLTLF